MRILLINPKARSLKTTPAPPLGLMCVAAMVKDRHRVRILDRNIGDQDLAAVIQAFEPDLIGVSVLTGPALGDAVAVSRVAKRRGIPIVWGGVHPSILPEQALSEEYVDFVVIGEGERTFEELVHHLEKSGGRFERIQGLGFKKDGTVIINKHRSLIKDLDALPFPAWDLIDVGLYTKYEIALVTSRGCPHRCRFCYNPALHKRQWRARSPQSIIKEIEYIRSLTNSKTRSLKFYDDNFVVDRERLRGLFSLLPKDYDLFLEARVNYIDREFLRMLAPFRSCHIMTGLESGDQSMLDRMHKDITLDMVHRAFRLFKRYRIATSACLMVGLPDETYGQILKTIRMALKLKPMRYSFCVYSPLPGTDWYAECLSRGLFQAPATTEGWARKAFTIRGHNVSRVGTWFLYVINYGFMILSLPRYFARGRESVFFHKLDDLRVTYASKVRKIFKRSSGVDTDSRTAL
jgi:radical SAM superfamily enzyme YgiQ (UPF0313 family)